jgi:flagellar motor protein MotB
MQAEGRGESQPVAPNAGPGGADNPEGRQRNRRVDVLLER